VVTSHADGGHIAIAPLGGDQPLVETALDADRTFGSTSSGEACVRSMLASDEAVLHVDNLQITR
jgi:hypothetical protein